MSTEIFAACALNSPEKLEAALALGENVNSTDESGLSPLIMSCQIGAVNMVKLLLEKGADPNYSTEGIDALLISILKEQPSCLSLLIKHGAQVNRSYMDDGSALLMACEKKFVKGVIILVKKGADINKKTISGTTPLITAVYKNADTIAQFLLTRGADFTCIDDDGDTALSLALSQENKTIIFALLDAGAKDTGADKELYLRYYYEWRVGKLGRKVKGLKEKIAALKDEIVEYKLHPAMLKDTLERLGNAGSSHPNPC